MPDDEPQYKEVIISTEGNIGETAAQRAERLWAKIRKRNNLHFLKDYFKDDFSGLEENIPYQLFEEQED